MSEHTPIILIEVVMVFGGALLFGWWQLRSIRKDQADAAARRNASQPTPTQGATRDEDDRPSVP